MVGTSSNQSIDYKKEGEVLAEWLKTQNHLPNQMESILLVRFVHSCHGDLERAKDLINLSFGMRTKHEHIFLKRDPLSPESMKIFEVT